MYNDFVLTLYWEYNIQIQEEYFEQTNGSRISKRGVTFVVSGMYCCNLLQGLPGNDTLNEMRTMEGFEIFRIMHYYGY